MDAAAKVAEQFGVYWPNLIAQVVLFAIVYWVLKRFAFKPVIAMLEERRRRIEEGQINAENIKKQLAAAPEDVRRGELVRVYLGLSPRGGGSLDVWCARALRREAREVDPAPVHAEFAKAIDSLDEKKLGKAPADLIFLKGAQAIIYLHGRLTPEQRKRWHESGKSGMNFLWDDLPIEP